MNRRCLLHQTRFRRKIYDSLIHKTYGRMGSSLMYTPLTDSRAESLQAKLRNKTCRNGEKNKNIKALFRL